MIERSQTPPLSVLAAVVTLSLLVATMGGVAVVEAGIVPVFVDEEVFAPPTTFCVKPDILSGLNGTKLFTQCDSRASRCNTDNFRCELGFLATPNATTTLFDYSAITPYGEYYPGAKDGKVRFVAQFVPQIPAFIRIHGFFQLWRLVDGSACEYRFDDRRQEYVDLVTPNLASVDLRFNNITAGTYRILYWDVGGTRLGSGIPEISPVITVGSVLLADMNIRAEVIPHFGPGEAQYTNIKRDDRNWISHHLVGDPGWDAALLNAEAHNRRVMWEQRSDQGNIINAAQRRPDLPPSNIDLSFNVIPVDDPFFYKHTPMMCGRICAKRTIIQARLLYIGLDISEYADYWAPGNREVYGEGTMLGWRIMALDRRVYTSITNINQGWFPGLALDGTRGSTLTSSGDVDLYTFPAGMRNFNFQQRSTGIVNGEAIVMDDFYTDEEFNGGEGVIEGQHYRLEPDFKTHTNAQFDVDYACAATGTAYSRGQFSFLQGGDRFRKTNGCTGFNEGFSTLTYGADRVLMDVHWGRDYLREYFTRDVGDICGSSSPNACFDLLSAAECGNLCVGGEDSKNRVEYFGSVTTPSLAALLDMLTVPTEFVPGNTNVGCNEFEMTGGCIRGFAPGFREIVDGSGEGMEGATFANVQVTPAVLTPKLDQVECYQDRTEQHTADTSTNTYAHFHPSSLPSPATQIPYEYQIDEDIWGTVGPDSWMVSAKSRFGPNNNEWRQRSGEARFYIDTVAAGYARFKVVPEITFLGFEGFDIGDVTVVGDESIHVRFHIACPRLEHGVIFDSGGTDFNRVGWCMDIWRITNQAGDVILEEVIEGSLRQQAFVPNTLMEPDDLAEVLTEADFLLRIKYTEGDIIQARFSPKLEPEDGRGDNGVNGLAVCPQTLVIRPVPPLQYIYRPMICCARVAPPACEYNSPEILTVCFRGQPYVFSSILALDLPDVLVLGDVIDQPRFLDYYEYWQIGGEVVQGFAEEFQLFEEGAVVTIYDRQSAITINNIPNVELPADNPNPLARKPQCISTSNSSCSSLPTDDGIYSGIDQFHVCSLDNTPATVLDDRLVFVVPFSRVDNVGALFYNITTEFVDVFIDEIRYKGIFAMIEGFVVFVTNFVTMTVRYGRTIDGLLEAPCYERIIALVVVLTPFQPDPLPLERDPACMRADNCCYFVPLIVRGNTPVSTAVVNLDTCSSEFDACAYEVVINPEPVMPEGLLCLGGTYEFTIQSPEMLVNARVGPNGVAFPDLLPWRCPTTFTQTLPVAAFAPLNVLVLPGPCSNPGAVIEVIIQYTAPECSGFLNAANPDPGCQLEVAFALRYVNLNQFVIGATLSNPFIIEGANSIPYNVESKFIFPDFFSNTDATLQDGQWEVFVWARDVGSNDQPTEIDDPRDSVSLTFFTQQEDADGIGIVRTGLTRPLCPEEDNGADPRSGAIVVDFIITDFTFDGPYEIMFLSPSNKMLLLESDDGVCASGTCNITAEGYCGGICPESDPVCDGCDQLIREEGIRVRGYVFTGVFSPSESGFFQLKARAVDSACNATYFEDIAALDSFVAEVHCYDTTCPVGQRSRTGIVESFFKGGTPIPVFQRNLVQGSQNEVYRSPYYPVWATPQGPTTIPFLTNVPRGEYAVNVTDFNNCTAFAKCTVGSVSSPMTLELVGSKPATCSDSAGELVFRVGNGTGTPPYTLVKVGPEQGPVDDGGTITLFDSTVVPGTDAVYAVIDALGCTSPFVNFSADPGVQLSVTIVPTLRPCNAQQNSGELVAILTGGGFADEFTWYLDGVVVPGPTQTFSNAVAGVYRVEVENALNCTAFDEAVLTPSGDITILTNRTDVTVELGTVNVDVFGGNDREYTLVVVPDNDGAIVVVTLDRIANVARFELMFVPAQWSGLVRVTDAGGCIAEEQVVGARIPVDIPFETPTVPPPLVNFTNFKDEPPAGWFWLIFGYAGAVMLFSALMIMIWPRRPEQIAVDGRKRPIDPPRRDGDDDDDDEEEEEEEEYDDDGELGVGV